MQHTWRSGWLAVAAAVGIWHCSIDDRSPGQVGAANQPGDAGPPGTMTPNTVPPNASPPDTPETPPGGGTGAAGAGTGAAGAGTGAASNGGAPGAAGAGSAGATGNAGTAGSAGTGGSTAMGTSGASGSGGIDPFDPFGGTPPTNSTCPAFTACGGELAGAWSYSDACADVSGSIALLQGLPSCSNASVRVEPGGAATLTFVGGQVSRQGAPQGDSVVTFPRDCVQDLGCPELAIAVGEAAQCSDVAGDCACRTPASVAWSLQPYTVTGGQLTLQDGRSFDYCVQGDRLTYRETGDAREPGTFTLQRN